MEADDLLALFHDAAAVQRAVVASIVGTERSRRTDVPGQYALDLIADAAVLDVLRQPDVAIVSEESGRTGPDHADVTIVVDPVDGSTNCSRGIPYWAISIAAVDRDGVWCALVANGATGQTTTAVRGRGASCDGDHIRPAATTHVEDSFIAVSGMPAFELGWQQFRALGSAALTLCDVAAGRVDGWLDCLRSRHGPWDYLAGLLVCREAGAVVVDQCGRELVVTDASARRKLLAAATPELLEQLRPAGGQA